MSCDLGPHEIKTYPRDFGFLRSLRTTPHARRFVVHVASCKVRIVSLQQQTQSTCDETVGPICGVTHPGALLVVESTGLRLNRRLSQQQTVEWQTLHEMFGGQAPFVNSSQFSVGI